MIVIGNKQYFLFPWAGGGNLINLWRARNSYGDRSTIARQHIPTIINQLVGLTGALARLHAFAHGNSESYRHGDLKPENILIFDVNNPGFLGVWKMADLGLARHHVIATGERSFTKSNFGAGTISYQPPETFRPTAAPTSRLYDVWCMGCIILQLMTWLHYGIEKVHELTGATKSGFTKGESSYWYATSWQDTTGLRGTRIHPAVTKHMAQMKLDVQGSGALQELLHIIETKLLVVQLPPNAVTTVPGCRTNAADLHQSLLRIQAQCNNPRYWNSGYSIAQQTGHLQIPQGWNLDVGGRNKVSCNFLISSIEDRPFLPTCICPLRKKPRSLIHRFDFQFKIR
jgi:serine/threonine protein kinase